MDAKELREKVIAETNKKNVFLNKSKDEVTFGDFTDYFLLVYQPTVKTVTFSHVVRRLKIINQTFSDFKLKEIDENLLQIYFDEISKKYAYNYVCSLYYGMNMFFKEAVKASIIRENPMQNVVRRVKKDMIDEKINFWTPEQFEIFCLNFQGRRDFFIFFNFLFFMGTRRGETIALQWKDIDLVEKKVNIYKTCVINIDKNPWRLTSPKTKNSIRVIRMPDCLYNLLLDWKKEQSKKALFSEETFLFGFERPMPVEASRRCLNNNIERINKSGIYLPKIRIHDFRHSHASFLIHKKVYDYDIACRLGDTVETLHNVYAHWYDNGEEHIIDMMNKEFGKKKRK